MHRFAIMIQMNITLTVHKAITQCTWFVLLKHASMFKLSWGENFRCGDQTQSHSDAIHEVDIECPSAIAKYWSVCKEWQKVGVMAGNWSHS